MSAFYRCPQGHRWQASLDDVRSEDGIACPLCGAMAAVDPGDDRPTLRDESAVGKEGSAATLPRIPGYEVLEVLGRGGMGVVYKARALRLNRLVALKLLLDHSEAGPQQLMRFQIEAEALASLQHPNVVQIYDVGEHELCPYLALELVEGGSLADHLRGQPMPSRGAAQLAETLARAVHAVHQRGIIHRDLKPGNVLLQNLTTKHTKHTKEDKEDKEEAELSSSASLSCLSCVSWLDSSVPKITDFGLAKRLDQTAHATRTGSIVGTPGYVAPEQLTPGSAVGPLADVYSLGALLYELLTGALPFQSDSLWGLFEQVLSRDATPPSRARPGIPLDLDTITLKCLEKDPQRRYPTAGDLADDLGRFIRGEPIRARPVSLAERLVKWTRRRPAIAGLLLLVLVLTLGGIAGVFAQWHRAEHQREQAEWQRDRAESAAVEADTARQQAEERRLQAVSALQTTRHSLYGYDLLRARSSLEGGHPDRAVHFLAGCPLDLRGWEWNHLRQRCSHAAILCTHHHEDVWHLAWSPDGQHLVTGSCDSTVVLWDPKTGRRKQTLTTLRGNVSFVGFSPDGKWLVSASTLFDDKAFAAGRAWERCVTGQVKLQETATWREVREFPGLGTAAFSPDSSRLAFVTAKGVQIVETATGQAITLLSGNTLPLFSVDFSKDGKKLFAGGCDAGKIPAETWQHINPVRVRGDVTAWDVSTGKILSARWEKPTAGVHFLEPHPDGKRVAVALFDGKILVWDQESGKILTRLEERGVRLGGICFTREGRLLATYLDRQAIVWDLDTQSRATTILGPARLPALSLDGRWLATGTAKGEPVPIYDLHGGKPLQVKVPARINQLAFSPDGSRLAALTDDQHLRFFDAATLREVASVSSRGMCLAYAPDGKRIVTGGRPMPFAWAELCVRDAATGAVQKRLNGHRLIVFGVSISADGRWLASTAVEAGFTGKPGEVWIWDLEAGKVVRELPQRAAVNKVAFSPDGKHLAGACSDRVVRIWDRETGQLTQELQGHDSVVRSVAYRPDGRQLASGSIDGTILLWDPQSGKKLHELRGHQASANVEGGVANLTYSKDGRRLASASSSPPARGEVKLWDPDTGVEVFSLDGKLTVAFRPDGHHVAAAGAGGSEPWQLRVWRGDPGHELGLRKGHHGAVRAVVASADGRRFASVGDDGLARIWDSASGEIVQVLRGHEGQVWHAAFSPQGDRLATAGGDRSVRVWDCDTGVQKLVLRGHDKAVRGVAWLGESRLATGGQDHKVHVWDLKTGKQVRSLPHAAEVLCLSANRDGTRLVTGSDALRIWDGESEQPLVVGEAGKSAVLVIAWSPDGRRIAVGEVGLGVSLQDASSGRRTVTLQGTRESVFALDWSRDGSQVVSVGSDGLVRVHETAKGDAVVAWPGSVSWMAGVGCLEGDLLASGDGQGEIRLWRRPRTMPP